MFGGTQLVGEKACKIHDKKIILPKFTTPSYKDTLIFYKKSINDIRLYRENTIEEKSKKAFLELKKLLPYREYLKYVRTFYGRMLTSETVNKNNSILIPNDILLHFDNYIYILGCDDHIKLYKNEEELKKYTLKNIT